MEVFLYVVYYNPKEGSEEKAVLISPLATTLDVSEEMVKLKAFRSLDSKWDDRLSDVVVEVKSF